MVANWKITMINIIIGCVLLYIGGWEILWNQPINIYSFNQEIIFGLDGIAIQVNKAFYGLMSTDRFFDSPILSMVFFGAGISSILSNK